MSEWKEYRFSDFVEINPRVKLPKGESISYIEMKDLNNGAKYCYPSQERMLSGGSKFNEGDTLFARITPCLENGKICQVKGLKDGQGLGSTEFHVFRGKDTISRSDFIYYLSRWDDVRSHAEINLDGTSGRQRVPKESFNDLKLSLPPLPEQKAIASVLSSLDDKIDLLHHQNTTLEKMAETLFRQWFVEEAKEEWRMIQFGDVVEVKRGGSPRPIQNYLSETGFRWLKISDATKESSPFIFDIKEHIKEEGLSKTTHLETGKLVLSNSATPGIPKILQVDTCIHDGWLHFPKSKFSNEFLYLFFKSIRSELENMGNGSIFTNLKTDIVKEFELKLPDNKSLNDFNEIIKIYFLKMLRNQKQIRTLTKLRDTLLPKLMSGEIKVAN